MKPPIVAWLVVLSLAPLGGCATGGSTPQDASRGGRDTGSAEDAAADDGGSVDDGATADAGSGCTPPCRDGDTCVGGRCVTPGDDADGDGVEASLDCDDADPDVGRTDTRTCSTECGEGTESCVDGVWADCNAPTDCSCECDPGSTDMESNPCGACGEGSQTRSRSCQSDCTWGAWGGWSACSGTGECAPGDTDTRTMDCGGCGTRTDTRTCDSATCTWNSWSLGTCSGGGECEPGTTRDGCDPCGHEVCQSDCTWGACEPKSTSQCLYESGTNWRCCGADSWQFCLSSCNWSTACESGCGCSC